MGKNEEWKISKNSLSEKPSEVRKPKWLLLKMKLKSLQTAPSPDQGESEVGQGAHL